MKNYLLDGVTRCKYLGKGEFKSEPWRKRNNKEK
jgi:hypothetical protein